MHRKFFYDLEINVHIDVYSAQTGISKFLELNRKNGWIYNKTEGMKTDPSAFLQFTHLLIEAESDDDARVLYFKNSHTIQAYISAYKGIEYYNGISNWKYKYFPIIKILQKPRIYILKKNSHS